MSSDRSLDRNVHFYDATDPDASDALGGLIQNGSVTEANFLQMLGILLIVESPIHVQHRSSGKLVSATNNRLLIGTYDVYCESRIHLTDEPWVHRIISHNVSGGNNAFRNGIRARDGKCVISGVTNLNVRRRWTSFEVAHIFPLEKENYWNEEGYGRWVTDLDDTSGVSKINSLQNGLLLRQHIHGLFDQYLISVNPDDNYKITVFDLDMDGVDGRILDPVCRDPEDPRCVSVRLLRWHFRQSVLANMRGAGEPVFESDFPPGMDMMEEIRGGPYAKERLELEVASRLRVWT
ncbi:HNH endonuclease-domain-containing protein [Tuber indicum]|nr:HNH endonuclease-domain-containing protein [Tuber indicum]